MSTTPVKEMSVESIQLQESKTNKIKNEEYKIWKKVIPSFYQHISTFKPMFAKNTSSHSKTKKTLIFSDKVFTDKSKGTLTTSVLYAQGSNVFEIDAILPMGIHNLNATTSGNDKVVDPQYESFLKSFEEKKFDPKWSFNNETFEKLQLLIKDDIKFIGLTSSGSVGWFKDEITTPVKTEVEAAVELNEKCIVDFDISEDSNLIVKSKCMINEEDKVTKSCVLKLIDNKDKISEVIRTINVKDGEKIPTVVSCRFLKDSNIVAALSTDSTIRFWDLKSENNSPVWTFQDNKEGELTSFDTSKVVDTLFATGSTGGVIKVWDLRAIIAEGNFSTATATKAEEIAKFTHFENDEVVEIKFSQTSPCNFLTVGKTGNVYQWDLEYIFSRYDDDNEDDSSIVDEAELQSECLAFYHTGGSRRTIGSSNKKNTVGSDSVIDGLVCSVDDDGLLTVYKPFLGRIEKKDVKEEKST